MELSLWKPIAILILIILKSSHGVRIIQNQKPPNSYHMCSSTEDLIKLVEHEWRATGLFVELLRKEPEKMEPMRDIVTEMKMVARERRKHKPLIHYAEHPINAYKLIRRWVKIGDFLNNNRIFHEFRNIIQNVIKKPKQDDLDSAAMAIIRLQSLYGLKTDDLKLGNVKNVSGPHSISNEEAIEIGTAAHDMAEFQYAIEWFEYAISDNIDSTTINLHERVYFNLAKSYHKVGDYVKGYYYAQQAYVIAPNDTNIKHLYSKYKKDMEHGSNSDMHLNTYEKYNSESTRAYMELCRGEVTELDDDLTDDWNTRDEVLKPLHCCFKTSRSIPYLRYKEEVMLWDPKIVIYHDVVSDLEANAIQQLAYPKLARAQVGMSTSHLSNARVSKVSWLYDSDSPVVLRLSQRVADISGLNTDYREKFSRSEPFQIVNYGIGGQYEPHYDYNNAKSGADNKALPSFLNGTGERIATFLFYLSDTLEGGATVFPKVNIRVPPVKNGAVLWYNIKRSGEVDKRTLHAGCPVLLGTKWVMNKWIKERGQEFTRQCGIGFDDTD